MDGQKWSRSIIIHDVQNALTRYVWKDYYYTPYPNKKIKIHIAGVSGDCANDVLYRFEEDIAFYKPKYTTILIGINDGGYLKFQDKIFKFYEKDMTKMLDKLDSLGTKAILMTPTIYDHLQGLKGMNWIKKKNVPETHYDATLVYFDNLGLGQANFRGLGYVNLQQPLYKYTREIRKTNADFTFVPDAVHTEADGQLIMALSILQDIEASDL